MSTPATLLQSFRAERKAFQTERARHDAELCLLLTEFVAALFCAHQGLQAVGLVGFQEVNHRPEREALVTAADVECVWSVLQIKGPAPVNASLGRSATDAIRRHLLEFWPTFQRKHGYGWALILRRDDAAEGGVSSLLREDYSPVW